MNPDFKPLADALYRERVLRARRVPPEERLLDGIRLYDQAVERMRLGVKLQHPAATEEEVERLLVKRIRKSWKLSDHGYYRPA
ncbi:MAG: hypothetical protein KIT22_12410 [Verrucomicrobiae bacterium]|nr:hypothetical protein [Verrucomicrobiae bacterium]